MIQLARRLFGRERIRFLVVGGINTPLETNGWARLHRTDPLENPSPAQCHDFITRITQSTPVATIVEWSNATLLPGLT